MNDAAKGVLGMAVACTSWGLLTPFYFRALGHIPASELLAQRILWSALLFSALLAIRGRLGLLASLLFGPAMPRVLLAALAISLNWAVYIWAVNAGRLTEMSMGYFLFPIAGVLFGRLIFGERLSGAQWGAVGLAAAGIVVLLAGLGIAPWLALAIALTFAFYGVAKKGLAADPTASVTAEVVLLAPFALGWLAALHLGVVTFSSAGGDAGWFGRDLGTSAALMASGLVTAVPLILFSVAARNNRLATVGLVQYINPSLQFIGAVMFYGEVVTQYHLVAFGLIWLGLMLYSADALRRERRARNSCASVATSGTTVA
jgi:chloramphenicol-sensitive protein RarD